MSERCAFKIITPARCSGATAQGSRDRAMPVQGTRILLNNKEIDHLKEFSITANAAGVYEVSLTYYATSIEFEEQASA